MLSIIVRWTEVKTDLKDGVRKKKDFEMWWWIVGSSVVFLAIAKLAYELWEFNKFAKWWGCSLLHEIGLAEIKRKEADKDDTTKDGA